MPGRGVHLFPGSAIRFPNAVKLRFYVDRTMLVRLEMGFVATAIFHHSYRGLYKNGKQSVSKSEGM